MAHFRSTPGHGCLILSEKEYAKFKSILPQWNKGNCFEEDCDYSLPYVALPGLTVGRNSISEKSLQYAHACCKDYFPREYEIITGNKVLLEESVVLQEEKFLEDNKDNWVVICARGDWADDCPKGFVECYATIGRNRFDKNGKIFYVPSEEYDNRDFNGFVISKENENKYSQKFS